MWKKIVAITFIYICTVIAWIGLSSYMDFRTHLQDGRFQEEVGSLWGTVQKQKAPIAYFLTPNREPLPLASSKVDVDVKLDHRKRGLLWYSTYTVKFHGFYQIHNSSRESRDAAVEFTFPGRASVYDSFRFSIQGKEVENIHTSSGGLSQFIQMNPGETKSIEIAYVSQGMDEWWYDFGREVTQIRNFSLSMKTNFEKIDFPENSISPTSKKRVGDGWELQWKYSNLLSGVTIGMSTPHKLNPGPWVARVTRSAPVSLFLFFFMLFIFTTMKKIKMHPMNYFFLGASFFSFHLLLAYLVDHISIHVAFVLCSIVSIGLVVSYMKLVVGRRFAFTEVALIQFVYLVLFSYTFFFEQYTGLAVTILCILTLFIVMQITGRLDWEAIFRRTPHIQGASLPRACPYCRNALADSETFRCGRCSTVHHSLCWSEHGGCATYGCT
jgi:hypothetical protein